MILFLLQKNLLMVGQNQKIRLFTYSKKLAYGNKMVKKIILKLIKWYQKTLSMDHGPLSFLYSEGYCRFRPTCSEYTYQAVEKYGVILGLAKGLFRIVRCNPWNKGGFDPVK